MIKHIVLAAAIIVGSLFAAVPQQADAAGLLLRLGVVARQAFINNSIFNQNVVVVNRFGQAVVVNRFGQQVVFNNNFNRFGQQVVINRFGQRVVVNQNFGQRVVLNRFGQAVVVDRFGRSVIQRNVFVQPQRNLRIVEVPNLGVRRDLIVVRDRFGRVVDVRRQNVVDINRFRSRSQGSRIIIEQNVIRGR